MLHVKSFTFEQHDEINELFEKFPLAVGAHIFVSDGKLLIPVEDGAPINNNHKKINLMLQINEMNSQIEVIEHSNKVLKLMSEGLAPKLKTAEADKAEAEAKFKATPNQQKLKEHLAACEKHVAFIKDQLDVNDRQGKQNDYEVERLKMNIKLFEESITSLVSN